MFYAERKRGERTAAGDAIRARHRERAEARLHSEAELTRVRERQKAELKRDAAEHFERRRAEPQRIRWNQLTREERNAHRRKQYEARRAIEKSDPALEAKRRELRRLEARRRQENNPESVRASRQRWRDAHLDEVTRKQREYRAVRAEHRRSISSETTAEQSIKNWKAFRERHGAGPTAEESIRNWKVYRQSHGQGPTAEESARSWANFRGRRAAPDPPQASPPRAGEQELERSATAFNPMIPRETVGHDFEL